MKYLLYILFTILSCIFYSCQTDEKEFDKTPTQRKRQAIETLNSELVNNKAGWLVLYFPKTDSLLFSNLGDKIKDSYQYSTDRYGYGGVCFTMRFLQQGKVEMRADMDQQSISTTTTSEYKIGANSSTQLTFLTTNYIHKLVNDSYGGACDWLYQGHNEEGFLVFKTASYLRPACEYIIMKPLKNMSDFNNAVKQAYDNRRIFEKMKNPQLYIHKGGRVYFQSDYYLGRNGGRANTTEKQRYYLFMEVTKPNPIPDYPPKEFSVLGSGYCGTPDGITFKAGLRLNNKQVFADFKRINNNFEAELVEVYYPKWKTTRLVSKHLHPEGKITGLKAIIKDVPIIE